MKKKLGSKLLKGIKRLSFFAIKKTPAIAKGSFKYVKGVSEDSWNLVYGDKVIKKLNYDLWKLNSSYKKKYLNLKKEDKYPWIDSAILSGMTIVQMHSEGVPRDVEKAYEYAFPEQSTDIEFLDAWSNFESHDERLGFVSAIKGKLFEVKYLDHLNDTLEPGYKAELATSPTQQGWDIQILGPDNEISQQLQLKATTSSSYVKDAIESYPNIDVITLEDLKGQLLLADYDEKVTFSSIENSTLSEEILESTDSELTLLPSLLGISIIVFSGYRKKDLSEFNRDVYIAERSSGLLVNTGILGITGIAGIGLIIAKDYFLRKGSKRSELIRELKANIKSQRKTISLWEKKMSRRDFLKTLAFAPAAIKMFSKK